MPKEYERKIVEALSAEIYSAIQHIVEKYKAEPNHYGCTIHAEADISISFPEMECFTPEVGKYLC